MRGIENLMMDFYDHPAFVHELLEALADFNIAQVNEALRYDIDCVYFGDDWGQQRGLLMGRPTDSSSGRRWPVCTGPSDRPASSS